MREKKLEVFKTSARNKTFGFLRTIELTDLNKYILPTNVLGQLRFTYIKIYLDKN